MITVKSEELLLLKHKRLGLGAPLQERVQKSHVFLLGHKPLSVLNGILLCVLPVGSLDNRTYCLDLLHDQIGTFHQIFRRPHHQRESLLYSKAVSFLLLYKDFHPYCLHSYLVQSERGLSSAISAVSRPPTPSKNLLHKRS